MGAPVFADEIGDAAKKLSSAAYPFLKDVDWSSGLALTKPGSASAAEWTKAIAKAIDMGAAMDSKLLKAGVQAHHKAIGSAGSGVTSQADFEAINAALGRMIASVPESKTMDVYNAFSAVVSPDVPKYLMSTVKEADAKAAYAALMDFKDVVKAHPITPAATTSSVSGAGIAEAAKRLSRPSTRPLSWVQQWMAVRSRKQLRHMLQPLAAWMPRVSPHRPTSRPSMRGSARPSHQCRLQRSWMSTTPLAKL